MKRMSAYLGLALAACLSCFSLSAFAEPIASAYRSVHCLTALTEPQGVAMQRLELTLAMWRTGSQSADESLASNLRASSNHFVMTSAKPEPEGVGLGESVAIG
ncbi:hypothetical protein SAMN05216237_1002 [Pseudomonas yamanorum]|nr:hypothetical protein SAMN05216237_1002 [Pseudomonas yamanorum]